MRNFLPLRYHGQIAIKIEDKSIKVIERVRKGCGRGRNGGEVDKYRKERNVGCGLREWMYLEEVVRCTYIERGRKWRKGRKERNKEREIERAPNVTYRV